jgi:uncharacterized protein (TIGR00251 family)
MSARRNASKNSRGSATRIAANAGTDVTARIDVKVTPRASRDEIIEWSEQGLRVRVRAAPERGRANEAVEALLAETLGISVKAVTVVVGHTSSRKIVEIKGLDAGEVGRRLAVRVFK